MPALALALLLGGALLQVSHAQEAEHRPPNILFVLADDLGWTDVGVFDPEQRGFYETPHLDRLAAQGMMFTQAYTNAANCSPTRAALMSGQYYPHQPVYHVGSPSQGKMIPAENAHHLPVEKVTIAEALQQGDYASALIGKWHIGDPSDGTGPLEQGFDVNIGGYRAGNPGAWEGAYFQPNSNPYIDDAQEGEYLTNYLTRKAVRFIEEHQQGPFYLQLSYYTPHSPLQAPEARTQKYQQKEGAGGHDNATYAAMIASLDRGVGRLMRALDRLGLADETIVVFYSDNGGHGGYDDLGRQDDGITSNAPLKAGKGSFYEGGIRVPLIVRWPGVIRAGAQCDEPVTGIDFYPTFLEVAGLEKPVGYLLDGTSLQPLFREAEASLDREALFWHFPGYPNAAWRTSPVSVIRSGPWKLMKFYETGQLELYNLSEDLGEQRSLAAARPEKRRQLHDRLTRWLRQNDAPMPKEKSNDR